MHTAFLSLGSNIQAEQNITSAISCLRDRFEKVDLSPIYRSASYGFEGDDFINLAARVETGMAPLELKTSLAGVENRHGRNRDVPRFSDRTLDIDILLYNDLWLISPKLEIPREEILQAAHVLKPLADLAPDLLHPVKKKTIMEIWQDFPRDNTALNKITL